VISGDCPLFVRVMTPTGTNERQTDVEKTPILLG